MRKIDRLGWAAGFSCLSYGVRVGVRATDPDVLDQVVGLLPPSWKPARSRTVERLYSLVVGGAGLRPGDRRFNVLYADAFRLSRTMELELALKALESDLQLYVAESARRRLFVHAGVVRWRGEAIVIPGRSLSGKSTLVNELVRAGATYYSDEYAVCDSQGRVHPYAKPLSLRQNGGGRPKPLAAKAAEGGGRPGVKPLPVSMIVVTKYRPGARWRPRQLSPGLSVMALLKHTVSARRQPRVAFTTLRKAVSGAGAGAGAGALVLAGVRGEAREMVESLLDQAGQHASRAGMDKRPAQVPA